MLSDCFYNSGGFCTFKKCKYYNRICEDSCRKYLEIPQASYQMKQKEIKRLYNNIIKLFKSLRYVIEDEGDNIIIYSKPAIKIYIKDFSIADGHPQIVIEHY